MISAHSLFDHHMHSAFSDDSKQALEELIEVAIKNKKTHITFTDHSDIINASTTHAFCTDMPAYIQKLTALQNQYPQITLLRGTEVGFEKSIANDVTDFLNKYDFAIRVLSIHSVSGGKDFANEFRTHGEWKYSDDVILDYYQANYDAVSMIDNFHILGHLDYITRYTPDGANTDLTPYLDLIREILVTCIKKDIALDINTAGIRYGLPYFHPQTKILKLYKDLGGKFLTLGSDAHRVEDMNFYFKEATEILEAIGFSHITSFAKNKYEQIPIQSITI